MKLAIALLLTSVAWGQTPSKATVLTGTTSAVISVGPATPELKCGKYQHVLPAYDSMRGDMLIHHEAACAEDLHILTEREWQELLARIAKLEKKP